MNEATTSRLYDLWSIIYDYTFGFLVRNRQRGAMAQLQLRPGDRVLDLGVGTGIMLPQYPHDVTVVGMDLSDGMLAKAMDKVREENLTHCRLVRADAMHPPFAEQSFDHVMISHTVSVVSDPAKLIQWASQLIRPHGRIVVLNHFQSTNPVIAWFEHVLNPLFTRIGWKSDLALEEVLRGSGLHVDYCFKLRMLDLWQIVVLKHPGPPKPAPSAPMPAGTLAEAT